MASKKINLDQSQRLDITVRKSDSWTLGITLKDSAGTAIDLFTQGYIFSMQIRKVHGQNIGMAPMATTPNYPGYSGGLADLPSINISANNSGLITISMSSSEMLRIAAGAYIYDLQYNLPDTNPDTVKTILKGNFLVNPDVAASISGVG